MGKDKSLFADFFVSLNSRSSCALDPIRSKRISKIAEKGITRHCVIRLCCASYPKLDARRLPSICGSRILRTATCLSTYLFLRTSQPYSGFRFQNNAHRSQHACRSPKQKLGVTATARKNNHVQSTSRRVAEERGCHSFLVIRFKCTASLSNASTAKLVSPPHGSCSGEQCVHPEVDRQLLAIIVAVRSMCVFTRSRISTH